MACALATGFVKETSRIKQGTVMGVVFSGMFGLGLVIYVQVRADVHLDHILFGDVLGVSWSDLAEAGAVAALVGGIFAQKRRDFLLHAFDPAHAQAVALPVRPLYYGWLALLSPTIVGALKAVGIILVIAMLISPGAIAFLLRKRFSRMLPLAILIAVGVSFLDVYASFFIDSAPAPTIVLLLSAMFVAAFLSVSSGRGMQRDHG